ncbi:hypothetical protein B0T19DRAFT_251055 [Cercophora scortea]|uniref:Uncharacterized protein n=1 Tax=Cercophora scortea TaxID=314031 RepID=A0AAE0M6I7_9PEZI|nr:hypothetical protein B0T19DRAFT_251055 [Cercophora scortea]
MRRKQTNLSTCCCCCCFHCMTPRPPSSSLGIDQPQPVLASSCLASSYAVQHTRKKGRGGGGGEAGNKPANKAARSWDKNAELHGTQGKMHVTIAVTWVHTRSPSFWKKKEKGRENRDVQAQRWWGLIMLSWGYSHTQREIDNTTHTRAQQKKKKIPDGENPRCDALGHVDVRDFFLVYLCEAGGGGDRGTVIVYRLQIVVQNAMPCHAIPCPARPSR